MRLSSQVSLLSMVYARITEVLSASLSSLSDYSLVFLKVDRR
jgi:hypothetical protein